jgi:hypothetical protein
MPKGAPGWLMSELQNISMPCKAAFIPYRVAVARVCGHTESQKAISGWCAAGLFIFNRQGVH